MSFSDALKIINHALSTVIAYDMKTTDGMIEHTEQLL